ncbi:hypothetical protein D7S78_09135 [Ralstonia pickettii]|nr:hypothetical protein [Ralstonia pickettii]MBA9887072.1 hypothetical protein [Ralstonia pickettii]MBA9891828.1 hypothetical protein [Ralstonia pickettii]MBA9923642.1 hypothetical protein [Ralstonia pickettii]MBB0101399.1 hypothetical protein [Ralstonia pickettii]
MNEFERYAHAPEEPLARYLRVRVETLRAWRSGARPLPWWVPELLRLRQMECDQMMRAAGYRRMGIARDGQTAQVYRFAPIVASTPAAPISAIADARMRA